MTRPALIATNRANKRRLTKLVAVPAGWQREIWMDLFPLADSTEE